MYNDGMTNTETTTRKRLAVDVANDLMIAGDATYRALVDLTEHDDHDTAVAASVALDAYLTAWAEAWVATADRMGYDAKATHCDATADEWCRVCPDEVEVAEYDDGYDIDPAHVEPCNGWGNVWAETPEPTSGPWVALLAEVAR